MVKKISLILALCILAVGLVACAPAVSDEQIADAKAKIDLINAKDFEALHTAMSTKAQELSTASDLNAALSPYLDQLGAFKSFGAVETFEQEIEEWGKIHGAVVTTEYEQGSVKWQIGYDADNKIISIMIVG